MIYIGSLPRLVTSRLVASRLSLPRLVTSRLIASRLVLPRRLPSLVASPRPFSSPPVSSCLVLPRPASSSPVSSCLVTCHLVAPSRPAYLASSCPASPCPVPMSRPPRPAPNNTSYAVTLGCVVINPSHTSTNRILVRLPWLTPQILSPLGISHLSNVLVSRQFLEELRTATTSPPPRNPRRSLTMFNAITRATIIPITHGTYQDLIAEIEACATVRND